MNFLDLLQRAVKQNGRAAFLSNGFVFEDQDYSNDFIERYMQDCGIPLQMWFSVDFFHGNYDFQGKRIPLLDNLLQARNKYASNRVIIFALICHWTRDDAKNIPIIKDIQKLTIFGLVDKYREYISRSVLEDIESMKESIRFAGCSVCLRLSKDGILQEINQRVIDKQ